MHESPFALFTERWTYQTSCRWPETLAAGLNGSPRTILVEENDRVTLRVRPMDEIYEALFSQVDAQDLRNSSLECLEATRHDCMV